MSISLKRKINKKSYTWSIRWQWPWVTLTATIIIAVCLCDFRSLSAHTHTHPFNGPFSGTTQVSWYQKGKTNLDFTEARDSEWQWHQLGHMQVCTSLQVDNNATPHNSVFLQAGCPSCHPTNSVKTLKCVNRKSYLSLISSGGFGEGARWVRPHSAWRPSEKFRVYQFRK